MTRSFDFSFAQPPVNPGVSGFRHHLGNHASLHEAPRPPWLITLRLDQCWLSRYVAPVHREVTVI